MTIHELAEAINEQAVFHPFGELQEIRKRLKGLSKKPTSKIFSAASISDDGWAFHLGGRTEIQFNIGFENDGLRYGLAFSLEPSQSLPDVSILYPKILRLNSIFRDNPERFVGYKIWIWYGERSATYPMQVIPSEWIHTNCFIFFGKIMDDSNIDVAEIINCFDDLLPIYIEVESENIVQNDEENSNRIIGRFDFTSGVINLPRLRAYTSIERETNIDIRHSLIQQAMYEKLVSIHGTNNVRLEHPFDGNRIDIVVKDGNLLKFYEIKTGNSAKSCIRQAIGQLLEYGFYPGVRIANAVVVVGEHEIDENTMNYLNYLNSVFNIPISYVKNNI